MIRQLATGHDGRAYEVRIYMADQCLLFMDGSQVGGDLSKEHVTAEECRDEAQRRNASTYHDKLPCHRLTWTTHP